MATKSIYIVTDLEGCLGVNASDPACYRFSYNSSPLKKKWAEQCTRELNAMIRGLQEAGAERFFILEGHLGCFIPELVNAKNAYSGETGRQFRIIPATCSA